MIWREGMVAICTSLAIISLPRAHQAQEVTTGDEGAGFRRAGNPQGISRLAHISNGPGYILNYVGGGVALPRRGQPPYPDEGTWGWDFEGWLIHRRVSLLWWHCRLQGGTGAYKTDGPH